MMLVGRILKLSSFKTANVCVDFSVFYSKYNKKKIFNKKVLVDYDCSFFREGMIVSLKLLGKKVSKRKVWSIFKIISL